MLTPNTPMARPKLPTNSNEFHEMRLWSILEQNPVLQATIDAAESLALPHWFIGAGCIAQTVWNHLSDFPINQGIKDIDFVYFDPNDLSKDSECRNAEKIKSLLPDFPLNLDVNNQARVHLWYETYFGYPIHAYKSVEDAIDTWPTTATAIAVRTLGKERHVYAPFGFDDLFSITARANKRQITKNIYDTKVQRWMEHWPSLRVVPWSEDGDQ